VVAAGAAAVTAGRAGCCAHAIGAASASGNAIAANRIPIIGLAPKPDAMLAEFGIVKAIPACPQV
jgi:hypothetical protein